MKFHLLKSSTKTERITAIGNLLHSILVLDSPNDFLNGVRERTSRAGPLQANEVVCCLGPGLYTACWLLSPLSDSN